MATEATVFVVDDDTAMRESLRFLVESVGLDVETFERAEDFLERYDAERPGCLILDVRMPEVSGLELQERLAEYGSGLPIIMVTGYGDVPMAVRAMRNGAVDFIEKPFSDQHLIDRVQEAIARDRLRRTERKGRESVARRVSTLSAREREVLDLVVTGKANKVIAHELGLSPKTVEAHRARLMKKLNVSSVAELVQLSLEHKQSVRDGLAG
ncbi:MAG: response regulator transcription factor [Deltaproteobacteria bacterium]